MTAKNSTTGKIIKPAYGEKITVNADNSLQVPNQPIIPFIEGDGIGADITPPMIKGSMPQSIKHTKAVKK